MKLSELEIYLIEVDYYNDEFDIIQKRYYAKDKFKNSKEIYFNEHFTDDDIVTFFKLKDAEEYLKEIYDPETGFKNFYFNCDVKSKPRIVKLSLNIVKEYMDGDN